MKKSANGNMYEVTLQETQQLFAQYVRGCALGVVCVVSRAPLSSQAEKALASALSTRGYGPHSCTFLTLTSPDNSELDAQALFLLLEGFDPLAVIAADEQAAQLLGSAYRQQVPHDASFRLFGRNAVAFASFEKMLEQPQSKQIAWALLKKIPLFAER